MNLTLEKYKKSNKARRKQLVRNSPFRSEKQLLAKLQVQYLNQVTKASNKAFNSSSKSSQAISLAKDVIAQINCGKIKPEAGVYLDLVGEDNYHTNSFEPVKNIELQAIIKDPVVSCEACAIGSMFTCDILKNNNFKVRTSELNDVDNDTKMRCRLRKIFTSQQLHLIEMAFEAGNYNYMIFRGVTVSDKEAAYAFGKKYRSDKKRLIAIMKNIIKNKGVFKP